MPAARREKSLFKFFFAISFLLVLGAVAMIFQYLSTVDQRALENLDTVQVLVSSDTISKGTSLDEAELNKLVEFRTYPSESVPASRLQRINDTNRNFVALGDIAPGQILVSETFGMRVAPVIDFSLPVGKVAVTVELNYASRLGVFIKPGVNVAVFSTFTPQNGERKLTTLLFRSVQVLAVGDQSNVEQENPSGEVANFITLAIGFNDAARLIEEYEGSKLHLALINDSSLVGTEIIKGQG